MALTALAVTLGCLVPSAGQPLVIRTVAAAVSPERPQSPVQCAAEACNKGGSSQSVPAPALASVVGPDSPAVTPPAYPRRPRSAAAAPLPPGFAARILHPPQAPGWT